MTTEHTGRRLKRLRELAGCSQAEVAQVAGVDRAFLSMVESGFRNINPETSEKIETYLRREMNKRAREIDSVLTPAHA